MRAGLAVAVLAAAAPLLAMASERWLGTAPCALCLWQRWPYWVAAALAVLAVAWPRALRPMLALAGLAALASGALATMHVGVEQGWWPSPLPGCAAPAAAAGSIDALIAGLPDAPSKPCDAPTYLVPGLPLSMAVMNLLYALGLGALALSFARRGVLP